MPDTSVTQVSVGIRSKSDEIKPSSIQIQATLSFLNAEERTRVIHAAESVTILGKEIRFDQKIASHMKTVANWNKQNNSQPGVQMNPQKFRYHSNPPPFLAGLISEEALPRVYRLLELIFRAVKPLECSLDDGLDFIVRGERVSLSVYEMQDTVDHIITKDENMKLLQYEDDKKHGRWASKPNIRKHDYLFNGRLCFAVSDKTYRDSESKDIEDQLGNIIIELFEASEQIRQRRLAHEETVRQEEEERKRREEFQKRRVNETNMTNALVHEAEDYSTACAIRAYADAMESSETELTEEQKRWITWARAKADWFDPCIEYDDPLLGRRKHGEELIHKEPFRGWF